MVPTNTRNDTANLRRQARAERQREVVRDRRRFVHSPVPTGAGQKAVSEDAKGTIYPATVREWRPGSKEPILKDGAHNVKIGGDVLVGDLRGAHIVTLALEERATCPRACQHWTTCYGNNMGQTRRWAYTPELLDGLEQEVRDLCAQYSQVLVRLHVLGDFVDGPYVHFWENALRNYANLSAFGFTAYRPSSPVGRGIRRLRLEYGRRFAIRHSGTSGPWGSFTIEYPTARKTIGDAVVCPEQRDAMDGTGKGKHCGACGLCWQTDTPVVFVEH